MVTIQCSSNLAVVRIPEIPGRMAVVEVHMRHASVLVLPLPLNMGSGEALQEYQYCGAVCLYVTQLFLHTKN